jgi:hypothetical protein
MQEEPRRRSCRRGSKAIILKEPTMAKGQMRSNREKKKPKKEVPKTIAAAPSSFNADLSKSSKGAKPKK